MKTVTTNGRNRNKTISGLIIALMLMVGMGMSENASAQPKYNEQAIVIPSWTPVYDHPEQVRYFYLPDLRIFYDVNSQTFIYPVGADYWQSSYRLPKEYAYYNLNDAYVVVLNKKARTPWKNYKKYNAMYPTHYYYRFEDRAVCGYNENSKTLVYKYVKTGTEERLDALNRNANHQNSAYYTGNVPVTNPTLPMVDDRSRNNNTGVNIRR